MLLPRKTLPSILTAFYIPVQDNGGLAGAGFVFLTNSSIPVRITERQSAVQKNLLTIHTETISPQLISQSLLLNKMDSVY